MITTTLNALRQTRHLGGSISTGVYDDGELDALLMEEPCEGKREIRGARFLSTELMAQILFDGQRANTEKEGSFSVGG